MSVMTIQKAMPTKTSDLLVARGSARGSPIATLGGKARVAASSATALRVTTPTMYALRGVAHDEPRTFQAITETLPPPASPR